MGCSSILDAPGLIPWLLSLLPFKRSKACAPPTLGRSWQGPWLLSCGGELALSRPGCIFSNKAAYCFKMARKWLLSFPTHFWLVWRHWGHARQVGCDVASRVTGQGLGLSPGLLPLPRRSQIEPIECRLCDWVALCFAHVSSRAASSAVCCVCDNRPCARDCTYN